MTGEEPAPATGWCTNWDAYNTPRLWAMVADEDDPESWRQVAALGAMADTVKDQHSRLKAASDALMEAWPAKTNPGAQTFLTQMDILLSRMKDTKAKADQSAAALGNILEALRQAKVKIEPLYQQYLDKSDDLVPDWWDHAEDDLDKQARSHMIEAENAVAPHAEKIVAPAAYELVVDFHDDKKLSVPATAASPHQRSGSASGSFAAENAVSVPHDPPPAMPGHDPIVGADPSPNGPGGPGLAGIVPVQPGTGTAPVISAPLLPSVPTPPSSPVPPGLIIGGGGVPGMGLLSPSSGARGGALLPFGTSRGTATGSVIGSSPMGRTVGAKPTPPAWLPEGQSQTGGVLGTTGQPGRGGSGRSATRSQPGRATSGMYSGGRGRHSDRDDVLEFDPDNPWATAEGVSPVIEPSRRELRHDPGPNVIGWHG